MRHYIAYAIEVLAVAIRIVVGRSGGLWGKPHGTARAVSNRAITRHKRSKGGPDEQS